MRLPNVFSISLSDPLGAAGIQGDIKTFMANACYGLTAMTAVRLPNTITPLSKKTIEEQCQSLVAEQAFSALSAIKIGTLPDEASIEFLAAFLDKLALDVPVVCDTECFLENIEERQRWFACFKQRLLPFVTVLVINVDEVTDWVESSRPGSEQEMINLISALRELNVPTIVFTGGHLQQTQSTDLLIERNQVQRLTIERSHVTDYKGAGNTLSAAITANLAYGLSHFDAVVKGKKFVTSALAHSSQLGITDKFVPLNHGFKS